MLCAYLLGLNCAIIHTVVHQMLQPSIMDVDAEICDTVFENIQPRLGAGTRSHPENDITKKWSLNCHYHHFYLYKLEICQHAHFSLSTHTHTQRRSFVWTRVSVPNWIPAASFFLMSLLYASHFHKAGFPIANMARSSAFSKDLGCSLGFPAQDFDNF